ncbi:MAG: HEAT repeat domain-containing protein [Candidatus Latescibacteria bacterium]|jgi:hypothetical protein|nr:HEAT repeat domain-containing protein [Candidatus Latescibacterota bacterium]MDP7447586.1 HEAT repeat domain-containing protein [Candidatus Latescibacterota bacterium]
MMSDDRMRERVLSYLYGGLTPGEVAAFRAELETDEELARCLAAEGEGLHAKLPVGGGDDDLPQQVLDESRLLLRAALRQQAHRQLSTWTRLNLWVAPVLPRLAWSGGAAALLLAGVFLGRGLPGSPPEAHIPGMLVDVSVNSYDESSGQIELELVGLATTRLAGDLADPQIRSALTEAMLGDLEPGPRLLAVDLLRHQTGSTEIRQALSEALLKDENPGVRIAAAEALSGLAEDDRVRQALQQALVADDNPGVRVAAIEGLRSISNNDTRQVFERVSRYEENEYIRAEAQRALLGKAPAATHL